MSGSDPAPRHARSPQLPGLVALAAGLLIAPAAAAHGVHAHAGRIEVREGRALTILEDGESEAAEWLERLIVRDDRGRRLEGRLVPGACALAHDVPAGARWLVLQLASADAPAGQSDRLTLAASAGSKGAPVARELALTDGGNIVVLPLAPLRVPGTACAGAVPSPEDALERVTLRLDVQPAAARLTVVMPLGIARSFASLPRGEVLSPADQDATLAALRAVIRSRVTLAAQGASLPLEDGPARVVGLGDDPLGIPPQETGELSAWTARVVIVLDATRPPGARLELASRLFNGLVLSSDVTLAEGARCEDLLLSSSDAAISWPR